MPRNYPTYIYTNETQAKSKGEFIVRLIKPRYIAQVLHDGPHTELRILEWIDDWNDEKFHLSEIKKHALSWYRSHIAR